MSNSILKKLKTKTNTNNTMTAASRQQRQAEIMTRTTLGGGGGSSSWSKGYLNNDAGGRGSGSGSSAHSSAVAMMDGGTSSVNNGVMSVRMKSATESNGGVGSGGNNGNNGGEEEMYNKYRQSLGKLSDENYIDNNRSNSNDNYNNNNNIMMTTMTTSNTYNGMDDNLIRRQRQYEMNHQGGKQSINQLIRTSKRQNKNLQGDEGGHEYSARVASNSHHTNINGENGMFIEDTTNGNIGNTIVGRSEGMGRDRGDGSTLGSITRNAFEVDHSKLQGDAITTNAYGSVSDDKEVSARFSMLRKRLLSLYAEPVPSDSSSNTPSLEQSTIATQSTSHPLYNPNSPQYQALNWLANIDDLALLDSDPGVIQRYTLAVLYFSTGGPPIVFDDKGNPSTSSSFVDNGKKTQKGPWRNPINFLTPMHECMWKAETRVGGAGGGIRRCDADNNIVGEYTMFVYLSMVD